MRKIHAIPTEFMGGRCTSSMLKVRFYAHFKYYSANMFIRTNFIQYFFGHFHLLPRCILIGRVLFQNVIKICLYNS